MAVLTECGSVNVACFYASALAMLRPIGMSRLYRPVPSTVLTEQRGHILEVGLAPVIGVFREHHHICVLVGAPMRQGWAQLNGSPTEPNRFTNISMLPQFLYLLTMPAAIQ